MTKPGRRRVSRIGLVAGLFVAALVPAGASLAPAAPAAAEWCAKKYVGGGDHVPAGHEVSEPERYPKQLLDEKLLKAPGPWCLYLTAKNEDTSQKYISNGQLAQTWNMRPDFITLTVGGENTTIVDLITKCFDKVKDHDFLGANTCAATVRGNTSAFQNLANNLATIFQGYKNLMSGRPGLVVAVTNYPNPYPSASSASSNVPQLCPPLVDTAQTCSTRWAQLPPALTQLDEAIKKLNTTIADAVEPFTIATQGRFVMVDVYEKMRDHCMKMDVSIFTTVNHGQYTDAHNSQKDFGCSDPWFVAGSVGTKIPDYLEPASNGVLLTKTQTTSGMGVHPDVDGHDCMSDLVWEATKIKLGVPEAPSHEACQ